MSRFGVSLAIALAVGCAAEGDDDADDTTAHEGSGAEEFGCGTPTCSPPAVLTYTCQPVPLGTPGACAGGAHLFDMPDPDPDKAFPVGCMAELPFCVAAYPAYVQTCECRDDFGAPGEAQWWCPI